MVMMADPIFGALNSIDARGKKILYMSPRGNILDQTKIQQLAEEEELTILCGHYEGVDQRVLDHFDMEEVSIGDYILTGGELPAMVLIDTVARLIPAYWPAKILPQKNPFIRASWNIRNTRNREVMKVWMCRRFWSAAIIN